MATVGTVLEILEEWAPRAVSWKGDNVGLQVGSPADSVRGILVALDATEAAVAEARRRQADLLVTHHPLLFRPLQVVSSDRPQGRAVAALVRAGVALVSAHTNLDFTAGGTSHALAESLGLTGLRFLRNSFRLQRKLVTFVPPGSVEAVARVMAEAGAGVIGEYEECSFRLSGTGTFRGGKKSDPAVGRRGTLERVPEVRLEMVVPAPEADRVVAALKRVHPYEEVAYDLYPIVNPSTEYGMGVIGALPRAKPLRVFLTTVRRSLGIPALRYCGDLRRPVQRVAVCGGSGSDLLDEALRQHADVFVTADISYHRFHEAAGRIALIDAGHYETEAPVVRALAGRLRARLRERGETVRVAAANTSTNPIQYA
jgi:dinuclear metal center YbgI/SA1388 family protein